jgi:hypothetical protein
MRDCGRGRFFVEDRDPGCSHSKIMYSSAFGMV